jgi:peptidoglycan hydrolase-like protein with peptidoglycan-binding domain
MSAGSVGSAGSTIGPGPHPEPAAAPPAAASTAAPLRSERFSADPELAEVALGVRTLGVGARGDAAKRVQLALLELGYDPGRADGVFGQRSASALAQFQRASGLPASGILDAATLASLDARVVAADHPLASATDPARLDSRRFAADPAFAPIAAGASTLARGARGPSVEKLQWTLVSLGYDLPHGADASFGGETEAALRAFQRASQLPETGRLDKTTLLALDDAASAKVAELRALSPAPEEKALRYRVVVDLERCRVYVLERGTDRPVASYLTSPGRPEYPTRGDHFTLQGTQVMGWWRPPSGSAWAAGLAPAPPGIENPMGICKLSFGAYAQYFHGIPKSEERELGRPASHGCCRMSGANILEFHERYAGAGTDVVLIRDRARSDALARKFAEAGVGDRPITAGREYTAPYLYGEMGFNEVLEPSGRVKVGGRG